MGCSEDAKLGLGKNFSNKGWKKGGRHEDLRRGGGGGWKKRSLSTKRGSGPGYGGARQLMKGRVGDLKSEGERNGKGGSRDDDWA